GRSGSLGDLGSIFGIPHLPHRGLWFAVLRWFLLMAVSEIDPKIVTLDTVLGLTSRELDIPRARRVFVNRNLRMEDIQLVGFAMDYTLALYNQVELENLSIQLTVQKLVEKRGYPREILDLDYSPDWAMRGLAVDRS